MPWASAASLGGFGSLELDGHVKHDAENDRREDDGNHLGENLENAKVAFPLLVFLLMKSVISRHVWVERLTARDTVRQDKWFQRWIDGVRRRVIVGILRMHWVDFRSRARRS